MQCFYHTQSPAVGVCLVCGKGICTHCCRESDGRLTCSNICDQERKELNEINECAKKIYGVGKYKTDRKFHLPSLFTLLLGFLFTAFGFYEIQTVDSEFNYFFLTFGVICLLYSALSFYRAKKTGLFL